ncbi:MAG: hypothetical protein Q7L55_06400 [Actinomycetota bacterium]|nr:hypothetical protein [Actinomycetota bacterium]
MFTTSSTQFGLAEVGVWEVRRIIEDIRVDLRPATGGVAQIQVQDFVWQSRLVVAVIVGHGSLTS